MFIFMRVQWTQPLSQAQPQFTNADKISSSLFTAVSDRIPFNMTIIMRKLIAVASNMRCRITTSASD